MLEATADQKSFFPTPEVFWSEHSLRIHEEDGLCNVWCRGRHWKEHLTVLWTNVKQKNHSEQDENCKLRCAFCHALVVEYPRNTGQEGQVTLLWLPAWVYGKDKRSRRSGKKCNRRRTARTTLLSVYQRLGPSQALLRNTVNFLSTLIPLLGHQSCMRALRLQPYLIWLCLVVVLPCIRYIVLCQSWIGRVVLRCTTMISMAVCPSRVRRTVPKCATMKFMASRFRLIEFVKLSFRAVAARDDELSVVSPHVLSIWAGHYAEHGSSSTSAE